MLTDTTVRARRPSLAAGLRDFHVVDARSPAAYAAAHLPGAISLPYRLICEEAVADLPSGLLVVYGWGPGCNAATNAAARLAALGRSVKGGFEYWVREGHPVEGHDAGSGRYAPDLSGLITLPGGRCLWVRSAGDAGAGPGRVSRGAAIVLGGVGPLTPPGIAWAGRERLAGMELAVQDVKRRGWQRRWAARARVRRHPG